MSADLCAANFRNYHSLKDSSGPGVPALPKQSRIMWPSSDWWIPFQASHRAASGTFYKILPSMAQAVLGFFLSVHPPPPDPIPSGWVWSSCSLAGPVPSLCPGEEPHRAQYIEATCLSVTAKHQGPSATDG